LLYLPTVGAPYLIRAGMGRHFKNVPPPILFGLLRSPLTLALTSPLSLALLGLLAPLMLSLLFSFPLCFMPVRVTLP
jgi:hypothetical protein